MADLRDLRLRVTATVHNTRDETLAHLQTLEVSTSGLMSRNEALSRMVEGPPEEFTQLIVHECLHEVEGRLAPEVRYQDFPQVTSLRLNLRWRVTMLYETSPPGNGNKYFTVSVALPFGHSNPYRSASSFEVRAGGDPRYYSHLGNKNGWRVHLKMEAFHERPHDHWCLRVEQRRA